jgi:hypothetical protein
MISVNLVAADTYEVVVGSETETRHRVHMSQQYYRTLSGGTVTHEWVIMQAFRFLLAREPSTAILAEFDLEVINRYFPEFEAELTRTLGHSP